MQRARLTAAFMLTWWAPASSLILPARCQPASGRRSRPGTVILEEAAEEKHIVLVGGGHADSDFPHSTIKGLLEIGE